MVGGRKEEDTDRMRKHVAVVHGERRILKNSGFEMEEYRRCIIAGVHISIAPLYLIPQTDLAHDEALDRVRQHNRQAKEKPGHVDSVVVHTKVVEHIVLGQEKRRSANSLFLFFL